MESKKLKILLIILVTFIVIVAISLISVFVWYQSNLKSVSNKTVEQNELIRIEIEEGTGIAKIAELLEENNVIKNADVMKIYSKINKISNFQAGKYDLNNSEDMAVVIEHIVNGEVANEEIKITFIEGKNMRWVAKAIAENTINTEEDVFKLLEDDEYINSLTQKYWFLADKIKSDDIYYPLEGYLLPNTYIFENNEVSVKTIFNVMLNYMDKLLTNYEEQIEESDFTVHEILTLASMAELEGKTDEDRAEIIGVFLNRIETGMSLGSDVTAYYAFKIDMGDRDLYKSEINTENPYNTRGPNMQGKLPIGPIANPSKSAIVATLNYTETEALYFVADKTGKVYFTNTIDEHNQIIGVLKTEGLWYVYE